MAVGAWGITFTLPSRCPVKTFQFAGINVFISVITAPFALEVLSVDSLFPSLATSKLTEEFTKQLF